MSRKLSIQKRSLKQFSRLLKEEPEFVKAALKEIGKMKFEGPTLNEYIEQNLKIKTMKKETKQKIIKGMKNLLESVGDAAEEVTTDVKTKTGRALGMYTRDEVVALVGNCINSLTKEMGVKYPKGFLLKWVKENLK